ncbi:PRC-barrel domain-containing protein [Devosia sp. RR2S18]|uniref:PRC-barrel domain-containing protein n=1 Tax=Devosia rhizosphaerae TaxID=3049774 RepID=UPI00253FA4A4|nr:PRC-barrel domain-containing protein [Devosia sp. RR2S18]WIJ24963.1 PRC-barrel domain-containing protein [Devosia sp. RR2S18]
MKLHLMSSAVLLCCGLASSTLAAGLEPVVVDTWDDEFCRDSGTSVADLIAGIVVYGPVRGAEPIGGTEDLILRSDGEVLALVAEIGGFLDIGDVHVSVPWDQVQFGEGWARVPIVEDTVGDYGLLEDNTEFRAVAGNITAGVDDLSPGAGAWRASALIGDVVNTRDGVGFGRVQDLLISGDEAKAMIVAPNLGLGLFGEHAIPFQPLAEGEWTQGDTVFQLVYDQTEMEDIGAFACD